LAFELKVAVLERRVGDYINMAGMQVARERQKLADERP